MVTKKKSLFKNMSGPVELSFLLTAIQLGIFFNDSLRVLQPKWRRFLYENRLFSHKIACYEIFYCVSDDNMESDTMELLGTKAYAFTDKPTANTNCYLFTMTPKTEGLTVMKFNIDSMKTFGLHDIINGQICLSVKINRFVGFFNTPETAMRSVQSNFG